MPRQCLLSFLLVIASCDSGDSPRVNRRETDRIILDIKDRKLVDALREVQRMRCDEDVSETVRILVLSELATLKIEAEKDPETYTAMGACKARREIDRQAAARAAAQTPTS